MVDQGKKEDSLVPEKNIPDGELPEVSVSSQESAPEKSPETKEAERDEKIVSDQLRREIELMQVDDNLKKQAEQKANKISFLADDDKLRNLMTLAKEKGVIFAIKVAKSMNDPFILDTLHDTLVQEGLYKDFVK